MLPLSAGSICRAFTARLSAPLRATAAVGLMAAASAHALTAEQTPDVSAGYLAFPPSSAVLVWPNLFPSGTTWTAGAIGPQLQATSATDPTTQAIVVGAVHVGNWIDGPGFDLPADAEAWPDLALDGVENFKLYFPQPTLLVGLAISTGVSNLPSEVDHAGAVFTLTTDTGEQQTLTLSDDGSGATVWVSIGSAQAFRSLAFAEVGNTPSDQYFGTVFAVQAPVPEPAPSALLMAGLIGGAVQGARRRRQVGRALVRSGPVHGVHTGVPSVSGGPMFKRALVSLFLAGSVCCAMAQQTQTTAYVRLEVLQNPGITDVKGAEGAKADDQMHAEDGRGGQMAFSASSKAMTADLSLDLQGSVWGWVGGNRVETSASWFDQVRIDAPGLSGHRGRLVAEFQVTSLPTMITGSGWSEISASSSLKIWTPTVINQVYVQDGYYLNSWGGAQGSHPGFRLTITSDFIFGLPMNVSGYLYGNCGVNNSFACTNSLHGYWAGIDSVVDLDSGASPVGAYTATSATSGFNYALAAVPEASTAVQLGGGIGVLLWLLGMRDWRRVSRDPR